MAAWARASALRSLSENERNTTSAGVCPRSTASTVSSSDRTSMRGTCMRQNSSVAERRRDSVAVDASLGDHHETTQAGFACAPWALEVAAEPAAHSLHQHPHRLAGDLD